MQKQNYNHALPAGTKLEAYEIIEAIGAGGFGVTYKALDTHLKHAVAIKEYMPVQLAWRADDSTIIPKSDADTTSFEYGLEQFIEEGRTLARFKHSNIVRVIRYFKANGTAYLVMEYEHGQTFKEYLHTHPRPDEATLLGVVTSILNGLKTIHEQGFLHRDIKPSNIYFRDTGEPLLIDFGSARQALTRQTQSITGIVSEGYAPFEQYTGNIKQTPATDLYGLGATLYHAISNQSPINALERFNGVQLNNEDPLTPAVEVESKLYSPFFLELIDWLLAVYPENRPQSVDDVVQSLNHGKLPDLTDTETDTKTKVNVTLTDYPGLRPKNNRRHIIRNIAISLGVVAALLIATYLFYPSPSRSPDGPMVAIAKPSTTKNKPNKVKAVSDVSITRSGNNFSSGSKQDKLTDRRYTIVMDPQTQTKTRVLWNGKKTYQYRDGRISVETYKDGKLNGPSSYTRTDGTLKWKRKYKDGKLDGFYNRYNLKGKLVSATHYKQGTMHGEDKVFYSNGKLHRKRNRKNGKLDGIQYFYGAYKKDGGIVSSTESYIDGKKSGEQKTYFRDGSVKDVEVYTIDKTGRSQRHGKFIARHSNKKIRLTNYYVNGSRHGLQRYYYSNGKIASQKCYQDGKNQDDLGICTGTKTIASRILRKHYINGNPKIEYQTKDGQYHGFVKRYGMDGWLKSIENYQNGKRNGKSSWFYMNKKPEKISFYKNHRMHGIYKTYYKNGVISASGTYKNGKLEGVSRNYNKDGRLINEIHYKDDKKHGLTKLYNNKIVEKRLQYDQGYLVSSKEWNQNGKLVRSKEFHKDGSEK